MIKELAALVSLVKELREADAALSAGGTVQVDAKWLRLIASGHPLKAFADELDAVIGGAQTELMEEASVPKAELVDLAASIAQDIEYCCPMNQEIVDRVTNKLLAWVEDRDKIWKNTVSASWVLALEVASNHSPELFSPEEGGFVAGEADGSAVIEFSILCSCGKMKHGETWAQHIQSIIPSNHRVALEIAKLVSRREQFSKMVAKYYIGSEYEKQRVEADFERELARLGTQEVKMCEKVLRPSDGEPEPVRVAACQPSETIMQMIARCRNSPKEWDTNVYSAAMNGCADELEAQVKGLLALCCEMESTGKHDLYIYAQKFRARIGKYQ